ncbi:YggT family protein [Paenibacillus nanensis]|uniref:YggT family protein n=1 Tax=Paenibacillus nanensis TaxID=393251 RepID=A0A3A1VMI5_9BACL|nr:YggT family protein [Paenibacillus nanensis]RIX59733.1 YggT family protein [Paenibacillus nanensis]
MEHTILSFVNIALEVYRYLIFGYVLLSWFPNARESFIGQLLGRIVEPYIGIFRRFIPPIGGVLDLSPIVALFALWFINIGLQSVLIYLFDLI